VEKKALADNPNVTKIAEIDPFRDPRSGGLMTVRALPSQEALHVASGAVLGSAGRDAMTLERDGHVMTISVDRGVGEMLVELPVSPHWDDGGTAAAGVG
jgi:hypothetical protein